MAVKPLQTVERAMDVIEAIAGNMPIGVAALARLLGEDKSALQRVLVTLHGCGWIAPTDEDYTRWRLTTKPLLVVAQAQDRSAPLRRARAAMESLRDETGETLFMVVPEAGRAVVVDVIEGRNLIRIAPPVGLLLPMATSAGGRAMTDARPGVWTTDRDIVTDGATCIASPFVEAGRVHGALVLGGPTTRMTTRRQRELGARVAEAAAGLAQGEAARPAGDFGKGPFSTR